MLRVYSLVWKVSEFVFREHAEVLSGVNETIGKWKVRTWEDHLNDIIFLAYVNTTVWFI